MLYNNASAITQKSLYNPSFLKGAEPTMPVSPHTFHPEILTVDAESPLHKIRVATYNRAHPIPTLFDMRHFQSQRIAKQNLLLLDESDISLTQETTLSGYRGMLDDYCGVSIDYQKIRDIPVKMEPTIKGKRAWTGLAIFFNPKEFQMDYANPFRFLPFNPSDQKGWKEVRQAINNLLFQLFSPCMPYFSTGKSEGSLRSAFKDLFGSFSGPLRTDGLLVLPLVHQETQKHFVVCTTHLESFDGTIRERQLQGLIEKVNALKEEFPHSIIILGGDMNFEQREPITVNGTTYATASAFFTEKMEALPFDDLLQPETMEGQVIDTIHIMPPKEAPQQNRLLSMMVLPPDDYEITGLLSDHRVVLHHLEFN